MFHKPNPIESLDNLRNRVDRLLRAPTRQSSRSAQLSLGLPATSSQQVDIDLPTKTISGFLDFVADAMPEGELYLFGGVLRDLALFGRKGFNSDIDLVVEGDWHNCISYFNSLGAKRNKFGGFRLQVSGWPVDIWNAKETWAIQQGIVEYEDITSLTRTTVLNWDAILMNWRTGSFLCRPHYLRDINERLLDIVLDRNPNPLGMAVRVFRHLCIKDARKITISAAEYLARCTNKYSFNKLQEAEIRSYGNSAIDMATYKFFEFLRKHDELEMRERFAAATDQLSRDHVIISAKQFGWSFDNHQ